MERTLRRHRLSDASTQRSASRALGKRYRLGARCSPYVPHAARRADRPLGAVAPRGARRPRCRDARRAETFWALRDVSFEVARARSSASSAATAPARARCSRSSSRITEPTEGRRRDPRPRRLACSRSGTGLPPRADRPREHLPERRHPRHDAARRSRASSTRSSTSRRSEPFIDTPVKHYSSGMYLRLAFAVAAHLEPEILLVDEVLAVGDAAFQRSASARWATWRAKAARCCSSATTWTPSSACAHGAYLLDHGRIVAEGPTATVAAQVHGAGVGIGAARHVARSIRRPARGQRGRVRIVAVRHAGTSAVPSVVTGRPWEVQCLVESDSPRTLSSFAVTRLQPNGHEARERRHR